MRPRAMVCLSGVVLCLGGCAGYRLGPSHDAITGARSVQVNFFRNQTLESRLVEPVCSALRKNLQRDGTFRLNTQGDGDIVVNGMILRYDRAALSFQPRDILTARDFQVTMTAQVTAVERLTGKVILDRQVSGRTTVRVGSDFSSAERQALPLLAEDLARNITALLAEGTW